MDTPNQIVGDCPVCSVPGTFCYIKNEYSIDRCPKCRTLFVANPPTDTSVVYDHFYFFGGEEGGYGSYDDEKETMRATFETCLDRIAAYHAQGDLYDVGAATGYFLSLARDRGFNVSGIDISSAAAHAAEQKGIRVEVGTLETTSRPPSSCDIITLFDVLEHVADPGKMVERARELLRPHGIVMGSLPDSGSMYARVMGRQWHQLIPPEHLVWFTDTGLRTLFAEHGLEMLWTGRITKRFSIPYILQTAARWLHLPILQRVGSALRGTPVARLAIPLDFRDNLFFLARKL